MADVGTSKKFKNDVKKWIKDTAELHKKLDRLNRQVQKDKEFSQVKRQMDFVSKASKDFFRQIKSLFIVVK
jgi:hypothetical protein